MALTNDVKKGLIIMHNNEPYLIVEREFYKPGKGGAFNKLRLRSLKSGKIQNLTLRSTEAVDEVEVQNRTVVYSYNDGETAFFMDPNTFEMVDVPISMIQDGTGYLLADAKYILMSFEGKPLSIQLPAKMSLLIIDTASGGDRGNTSGNATKEAILETGLSVQVPLFVKNGDRIIVNTETGTYFSKDSK